MSKNYSPYNFYSTAILLLALSLGACSSTVSTNNDSLSERQNIPVTFAPTELDRLLREAGRANSPQAEQYLLEAARLFKDQGETNEAENILSFIDTSSLPNALVANILLLRAQLALENNQFEDALRLLDNDTFPSVVLLDDDLQLQLRELRATAYSLNNQFLNSAIERIYADRFVRIEDRQTNHERIWNALSAVPVGQLILLANNELNFEFQGWYQLAVIGKLYQYDLDRQLVELQNWRSGWVRHPASSAPPQALELLEVMAQERPNSIALLLPLATTAGAIVRDGFMSAFYNVQEIGGSVPEIIFYDTSNVSDIRALHRQARAEGAEMIIGPLTKEHVAQLQTESNLGVTTLALNNVAGIRPASRQLFQFSLSPENEARQIANKAWQDGHRYAAILSPLDTETSDFYARKRDAFIQQWQSLGGVIAAQEIYLDEYTDTIESLLNLRDSTARMEQLSDIIGESLDFIPRRRQDIDFIFLIAQPGPARQINPSLAYLYAGDIPVYASQDIYSGISRPLLDNDLNGVLFSDSPWLLSEMDEFQTRTRSLFPQNSAQNLRLQAFGIDAFRLYPRLRQLESVESGQIYGATGLLKLSPNRNIIFELDWARINEGIAELQE